MKKIGDYATCIVLHVLYFEHLQYRHMWIPFVITAVYCELPPSEKILQSTAQQCSFGICRHPLSLLCKDQSLGSVLEAQCLSSPLYHGRCHLFPITITYCSLWSLPPVQIFSLTSVLICLLHTSHEELSLLSFSVCIPWPCFFSLISYHSKCFSHPKDC